MLIGPAHTHRYRRFADALTGAHARLAEKRGWLVLRFSGLSPPILCQLAWRTVAAPSKPILCSIGGEAKSVQVGVLEDEPNPDRLPGQ